MQKYSHHILTIITKRVIKNRVFFAPSQTLSLKVLKVNYKIKIDNIGKLKKADISVRSLTILAGPNNTGKSFFSKALYSVFNAINTNPFNAINTNPVIVVQYCLKRLQESSDKIRREIFEEQIEEHEQHEQEQIEEYKQLELVVNNLIKSAVNNLKDCYLLIRKKDKIFLIQDDCKIIDTDIIKAISKVIKSYTLLLNIISDKKEIKEVKNSISTLQNLIDSNSQEIIAQGFNRALDANLTGNFQIPDLQDLKRDQNKSVSIDIVDVVKVTINGNKIETKFSPRLSELQSKPRVVYIESPFYWKLRHALSRTARSSYFHSKRRSLLVPKYFNDLDIMLIDDLSGEMAFPDIFKDLTTKIIKGTLTADEAGTLKFKELNGDKLYSLPMTATGIVQLGMLALLIEKKILDKDSILFIDEPETNLHPAWQIEMMEILFRLVKAGVYVITATHSADILKWLEVHLKKHSEDIDLIALNQMKVNEDGTVSIFDSDKYILEKIIDIKNNLTEPFFNLFLKDQQEKE